MQRSPTPAPASLWGHYLATTALLVFYGNRVCPFIDAMPLHAWAALVAGVFLALWLVRLPLARLVLARSATGHDGRNLLLMDLALYLAGGLVISVIDYAVFHFPHGSGTKVLVGCLALGAFTGLEAALARERQQAALGRDLFPALDGSRLFPVTRKVLLVASMGAVLGAAIVILVAAKDILEFRGADEADVLRLARGVALEIGYVAAVLTGLALKLTHSYARNLKLFFGNQMRTLAGVAAGDLDVHVPVASADEFGLIASHTNEMIAELREKQRIRRVLGKIVNPVAARRLLADGEDAAALGGERREVAVLFCDVRDFTSRTETNPPEVVVAALNAFFTRMVAVVHASQGVVDKFIGDGMLAVFGLSGEAAPCDAAVDAAQGMLAALDGLNAELRDRPGIGLRRPLGMGIGIHQGMVVAGLIGSAERLEFTVIGDTVNTASRLEGLTREVGLPLVASAAVHAELSPRLRSLPWTDLGPRALKGKARPVEVLGLRESAPAG